MTRRFPARPDAAAGDGAARSGGPSSHRRRVSGIRCAPAGSPVGNGSDGRRAPRYGQGTTSARRCDERPGPRPHFAKPDHYRSAATSRAPVFSRWLQRPTRRRVAKASARTADGLVSCRTYAIEGETHEKYNEIHRRLTAFGLLAGSAGAQTLFNYSGADPWRRSSRQRRKRPRSRCTPPSRRRTSRR